jgi:hypothetical protein
LLLLETAEAGAFNSRRVGAEGWAEHTALAGSCPWAVTATSTASWGLTV